jgi:hypothetical protein
MDHRRSTHEKSLVISDAIHARKENDAATMITSESGDIPENLT